MSVRTDQVNINVNINGNTAQNQLNDLRKKATEIAASMVGLKKSTQEWIDKNKELSSVNSQMAELKKTIGLTSLSLKELASEQKKLTALFNSSVPGSAEYKAYAKQLDEVSSRIYNVKNNVSGLGAVFSKIGDEIKQFGLLAVGYLGFQFITEQFKNIIQGAGKLSDQLADLQRVAGLTSQEAQSLNKSLAGIDTRTSVSGLRDIAIIAGKLGVAKEDIFGFTKAVDQLVVTLGDELGNADQITTQLGKILNVFDGKVTGDNISKLGNAFVELANTGAATGGFIADFDQRLSGIAKSAGISLGALSGLGAGLEEMGGRVESAATAIQKLVIHIASDIPAAAKIAGQSTAEFNKLFQLDPTEAILKYSQGLVKNKNSFAEVTASFKDAGEEGARVIETLTKLGTGADKLRERIDLGKKSIEESSAITAGFALKNETFGATLDKLGKQFNALVTSSALTNFLKGGVEATISFINALKKIPQFIDDNSLALKFLITGIVLLNFSYIKSAAAIALDTAAKIANTIVTRATAVATGIAEVAQASYIVVTNLLTGRIGLAIAAQRLWAITLSIGTGAIGAIVTVVAGLVIGLSYLIGKTKELTAEQRIQEGLQKKVAESTSDELDKIKTLGDIVKSAAASYDTKAKALAQLIALNPEYLKGLTLENFATAQGTEIINTYIKALKEKATIEATSELRRDKLKEQVQAEFDLMKEDKKISEISGAGAVGASILGQVGLGKFAAYDEAKKKVKDLKDDIVQLDKLVADNIKKNPSAVLGAVTGLDDTKIKTEAALGLIKALQEKIKALDDARPDLTTKKAITQNLAERKKLQDQLDALEGKTSAGSKSNDNEYNKLKKEYAAFLKDLEKMKTDSAAKALPADQEEIQKVEDKYNILLQKAADYYKKLVAADAKRPGALAQDKAQNTSTVTTINTLKMTEITGVIGEQDYKKSLELSAQYFEEKQKQAVTAYGEGFITDEQYQEQLKNLERDAILAKIKINEDYLGFAKSADAGLVAEKKKLYELDGRNYTAAELKKVLDFKKSQADIQTYLQDEVNAQAKLDVSTARPGSKNELQAKKNLLNLEKAQEIQATKDKYAELGIVVDEGSAVIQEINASYAEKNKQLDQDYTQNKIEEYRKMALFVVTQLTTLNTIVSNLENRELAKDRKLNAEKKKNLKDQLDHKLISREKYDKKVQALDDEQAKKESEIRKKQAQREKALAIFTAIINTAAGIAKASPVVPLMVLAAVVGALQIAAIASTPLPEAAEGNWFRKGPKHKDPEGGIPVMIERDEAVVKADAMTDNKRYTVSGTPAQITSKLNNMHGGINWAPGALIQMPKFRERPAQINPNLPRIMAEGGLGIVRQLYTERQQQPAQDDRVVALLEKVLEATDARHNSIRAHVVLSDINHQTSKYNKAKKASGLG